MTMTELIKFDEKSECVNSFYKDFNVWFYIRHKIFLDILSKENNADVVTQEIKSSFLNKLKFILLSLCYRIPRNHKNILFFSSNVVNMKNNNIYINRLYDFFYNQNSDNSIIIEDCYNLEYRRPRAVDVFYTGIVQLKFNLHNFIHKMNTEDQIFLSEIVDKIQTIFSDYFIDDYWKSIKQIVYYGFCFFKYATDYYFRLFTKVNPKIIFREDASYGHYQYLSVVCKQLNIIFAEFQHGYVGSDHIAYNYGESFFKNSQLKSLLPEYFLTFGEYWQQQIKHPAKKISVGFPYLQEKKENILNAKNLILIVSDGDSPNQNKLLFDYVKNYAKENNLSIILKLHPCEYPKLDEWYGDLIQNKLIKIKVMEPVYDYLPKAKYVIGSASTVMYETFAFGVIPFVYESTRVLGNPMAMNIFNTFSSKSELMELIQGKVKLKQFNNNYFFDEKYSTSYLKFVNEAINDHWNN